MKKWFYQGHIFHYSFLLLLFLAGTLNFDDVNKEHRLPASLDRGSSARLLDLFTNVYYEDFNLPADCILEHINEDNYSFIKVSYPSGMNVADNLRSMYIRTNLLGNFIHTVPQIIRVKKSCERFLAQAFDRTNAYYAQANYSPAPFNYEESRPRPYCGTVPREENERCGQRVLEDRQVVNYLGAENSTYHLESVRRHILRPSRAWDMNARSMHEAKFYVIEADENETENNFIEVDYRANYWYRRKWNNPRNIDPNRTRSLFRGYVKYLQYIPPIRSPNDFLNELGEIASNVYEQLEDGQIRYTSRRRISRISARGSRYQIRQMVEFIQENVQTLKNYWERSYTLLRHNSPRHRARLSLDNFTRMDRVVFDNLTREEKARTRLDNLVKESTEALLELYGSILFAPSDEGLLRDAAANWWVLRNLRTRYGCDNAAQTPYVGLGHLVIGEYGYQTCRREYTVRGLNRLNYYMLNNINIELDSIYWQGLMYVTSRRERGELIEKILPLLIKRVLDGGKLKITELSSLATFYLQTKQELQLERTLTWKGLVPMSAQDRVRLQRDIDFLEDFFQRYINIAYEQRVSSPYNFLNALVLKQQMNNQIENIDWANYSFTEENLLEYNTTLMERIENLNDERLIVLYQFNAYFERIWRNQDRMCRVWLDKLGSIGQGREDLDAFWNVDESEAVTECYQLIPSWVREIKNNSHHRPTELESLCNNRVSIACETQRIVDESPREKPLEQWKRIFSNNGISSVEVIDQIDLFLAQRMQVMQGQNENLKRDWGSALSEIDNLLGDNIVEAINAFPTLNRFTSCISESSWLDHLGQIQILSKSDVELSCQSEDNQSLEDLFFFELLWVTQISSDSAPRRELEQLIRSKIHFLPSSAMKIFISWREKTKNLNFTQAFQIRSADLNSFHTMIEELLGGRSRNLPYLLRYGQGGRQARNVSSEWTSAIYSEMRNTMDQLRRCLNRRQLGRCRLIKGSDLFDNI